MFNTYSALRELINYASHRHNNNWAQKFTSENTGVLKFQWNVTAYFQWFGSEYKTCNYELFISSERIF